MQGAHVTTHKRRILVVDDDRLVLATLAHGLAQAGYDVLDADNGDDAILLARQHRPELALLDIRMEGKSGFDVADYLRESTQTPFMFLSAFSDAETVAKTRALGALASLVKPLDIGQVVPAVAAALAEADARRRQPPPGPGAGAEAAVSTLSAQTLVGMAAGVLMHRFSLARGPALERLRQMADADRRSVAEQAERVLAAVEGLAAPSL